MLNQVQAARVEHRFLLQCETISPLTHSSGTGSTLTDNPFRQTADGRMVVAGTAIAGVLRTVVERLAGRTCRVYSEKPLQRSENDRPCSCDVCKLFGNVVPVDLPPGEANASHATASRVWVYDARVESPDGSRIVDSVAINRERRAAEDAKKFDREELPVGARLLLEVRGGSLTDREQQWLGTALRSLATGQVGLGGGAASGSGRLRCAHAAIYRRDLGKRDHLLAAILHDGHAVPPVVGQPQPAWPVIVSTDLATFFGRPSVHAQMQWNFVLCPRADFGGTFLIADPLAGAVSSWDRGPRGLTPRKFSAELPARSVRGALRSGAERILNTLCPATAAWLQDKLFGSVEHASPLRIAVESDQPAAPSPSDHVAIDRFTGGASDGKKFDALAARGGSYRLSLTIVDAAENDLPWMKGLLALTLRDLHEGRITIGHGSAKGHGYFELCNPGREDAGEQTACSWVDVLQANPGQIQEWIVALQNSPPPLAEVATASILPGGEPSAKTPPGSSAGVPKSSQARTAGERSVSDRSTGMPKDQTAREAEPEPSVRWTARAMQMSIDCLFTIADALSNSSTSAFLESPTRCVIRAWSQDEFAWKKELAGAWQFRLFGEGFELAARRLAFDGPSQWAVRLVASDQIELPDSVRQRFQEPVHALGSHTDQTVNLVGTARTPGQQFSEERFAAAGAALIYPGAWAQGKQASLRIRRFEHQGGSVVCWIGLK